jgi:glycine betaine/choline ABC-type transport system substrate-binding protein
VRREVIDRWGTEFEAVVNEVSQQLTTAELRQLNASVAAGSDPSTVAREWLSFQDRGS